jgi:PAS domain S-box-containing protein
MDTERRYRKLVDYLTDYIYTVTIEEGEAAETFHGPGCVSVTGYTSDDYQKDPELWYRMVFADDKEAVLEQARRAVAGEQAPPLEHRIIHRDGTIRWIRNTIVVSKNDQSEAVAYDGLINDITALKQAEGAAAIRNEQLKQADKMASLGILVSGIAHEINNPNNFILLNVQLFSKIWRDVRIILDEYAATNGDLTVAGMSYSSSREKIAQSLDGILKGSERIQNITRSLTEYAKTDSGNLREHVDVNTVVDMAFVITRLSIDNATSRFVVDCGSEIPHVRGNAQQLEQVLINLINNACQSLRDVHARIRIATLHDKARGAVRIVVEDEGEGIRKGDLKHIMDPFFTTKRNMGGTGLGLSVSYNIITSHGGTLELESEPGKGTRAIVTLPVPHTTSLTERVRDE